MKFFNLKKWLKQKSVLFVFLMVYQLPVYALGNTGLPFETTMDKLKDAISGKFLTAISIIMIVMTCFMLAFVEMGEGMRKVINMVLWLSVAFGASAFVTSLFGG